MSCNPQKFKPFSHWPSKYLWPNCCFFFRIYIPLDITRRIPNPEVSERCLIGMILGGPSMPSQVLGCYKICWTSFPNGWNMLDFSPPKNHVFWKKQLLVTSWWLNHPSEKYARQIGSSPQVGAGVKIIDVVIPEPIGSTGRSIVPWKSVMGVIKKLLDFFPNDGTCWFFAFKKICGLSC